MSLPGINVVTLPFTGGIIAGSPNPQFETQLGPTGNPREVQAAAPLVVTSQVLLSYAVGAGATLIAQGPLTGGYLTNPGTAAAQGLETTENMYISELVQPGNADATGGNGPSDLLFPGQTWTFNSIPAGVSIYVNAPTPGHKFSGKFW